MASTRPSTIKLNVSGTKMEIARSTLSQMKFFLSYLEWENSDELFIDFDPEFSHSKQVLNKIRLPEISISEETFIATKYFGLTLIKSVNPEKIPLFSIHTITLNEYYRELHLPPNTEKILDIFCGRPIIFSLCIDKKIIFTSSTQNHISENLLI